VEDIYLYPESSGEEIIIRLILSYLGTPQYLRKLLYDKRPELRYVGILPPLRTPHHPLEKFSNNLKKGEFRQGVVLSRREGEFLVEVGVEKPLRAIGRAPSIGSMATVMVTDIKPALKGRFIGRGEVPLYWGYKVHVSKRSLGRLVLSGEFDLTIATSRMGQHYKMVEEQLRESWAEAKSIIVAFGSSRLGLEEILNKEGLTMKDAFHYAINTLPMQGVAKVRTEEAIQSTLAILNLLES
jgi:predicted SPOUT superfamily RNA methylase MTH1